MKLTVIVVILSAWLFVLACSEELGERDPRSGAACDIAEEYFGVVTHTPQDSSDPLYIDKSILVGERAQVLLSDLYGSSAGPNVSEAIRAVSLASRSGDLDFGESLEELASQCRASGYSVRYHD